VAQDWTINYLPEEGGRITGKLIVDDDAVRFEALYDSSTKTILKAVGLSVGSFAASGGHAVYLHDEGSNAVLVIPRDAITGAAAAKKGLTKRVVVSTAETGDFVFDYGMLSVKKIVAAINE
jgi:hypothetical protein